MPILPVPPEPAAIPTLSDRDFLQTASFGAPPPPQDSAYFLRMFDRLFPADYLEGLQAGGGYEVLRGFAAVGERVSLMASRWAAATLAGYATLGARATGWVYLFRDSAAAGAVRVKAGTVVATADQRAFFTRADVSFDTSDLGPFAVPVEATLPGFEYNVDGESLTPLGEIVPGQINQIVLLLQDPEFGDPSIRVRNVAPTVGGRDPQLEQLAKDRGVSPRHANESEEEFRLRVKTLTFGVTAAGIEQTGRNLLRKWSPAFQFAILDGWDVAYQTGYDGPLPGPATFPDAIFVYDDQRAPRAQNRWLSHEDANGGGFIAELSKLPCLQDQGLFLSDPAAIPADWLTPGTDGGRRAGNYLGLPFVLPSVVLPSGLSARDAAADGSYASVYKMLQDLKAGGTTATMILAGEP